MDDCGCWNCLSDPQGSGQFFQVNFLNCGEKRKPKMRWLILLIMLIGAALALQAGLVAFAGYVLIGVYLLSRYLAKAWVTNLDVETHCPNEPLEVGDVAEVVIRVRNLGSIPIGWLLVEEMLPESALKRPPRISVQGRRIQILFLRPRQKRTLKLKLTFHYRGYYLIGPFLAETGDVFGLHRRHKRFGTPHTILVYPKILPLPKYNFASMRPIGEIRLANRLFEDPTRTAGVRPYQLGDPLQRIHWRATARTGELHSRIYEPTTLAGATILLDFHKDGYHSRGEPYRSELAITLACSLANAVTELNQQIGLASNGRDAAERIQSEAFDAEGVPEQEFSTRNDARDKYELLKQNDRLRPVQVETRRGFEQFQLIRETLARVELADGSTFSQLILEIGPRIPKDATVIAILPKVPIETSIALGLLRRQGFAISVILVGIADDGSDELAQAHGRLIAEGVRDIRTINTEEELFRLGDRPEGGLDSYNVAVGLV